MKIITSTVLLAALDWVVVFRRCGGLARRCGGLVVRVFASRSPVPGSILGPGPPDSVVWGAADHTVILYNWKDKPKSR